MQYRTLDPSTGELLREYPRASSAEMEQALEAAGRAFVGWHRADLAARTTVLVALAERLEARGESLAELMALEMGKPLAQGRSEVEKCAWVCRYYAEHSEVLLTSDPRDSDAAAEVRYEPLGPVLAIMPWNFPFWQVFRFLAPALALGNVGLLKHAPSTPGCALAIVDLVAEAGAPEGVLQNLFLSNEQAAELIADSRVRGVTLTGSTAAGREVAAAAGRALKPMVAELGGSDPFLVFEDADLEAAVRVGVQSRCLNSGQSCIAAKRFLVAAPIWDEFVERFTAAMAAQRVGNPTVEGIDVGPLARHDLRQTLVDQVEAARQAGGRVLVGGEPTPGPGFYYPPTVIAGLDPRRPPSDQEFFGPVATVYRFSDEEEALSIANATPYGLGASVWTEDRARLERLVPRLEVGSVFVRGLVKSDPRLPFGGVKDSGFGRELAREGMLEFANVKTVWVG